MEEIPSKLNAPQDEFELFRAWLENIIDQSHPLIRLARLIDWQVPEDRFGALYAESAGRPALPAGCDGGAASHPWADGYAAAGR